MPGTPPDASTAGIQRPGPSSMLAVMNIVASISRKSGDVNVDLNIAPVETPDAWFSVAGNSSRSMRKMYTTAGIRMRPRRTFHDVMPICASP